MAEDQNAKRLKEFTKGKLQERGIIPSTPTQQTQGNSGLTAEQQNLKDWTKNKLQEKGILPGINQGTQTATTTTTLPGITNFQNLQESNKIQFGSNVKSNIILPGISEPKYPNATLSQATQETGKEGNKRAKNNVKDTRSMNEIIHDEMVSGEYIPLLKQGAKQTWNDVKKFAYRKGIEAVENFANHPYETFLGSSPVLKALGTELDKKRFEDPNVKSQVDKGISNMWKLYYRYEDKINKNFDKWVDQNMNKIITKEYQDSGGIFESIKKGDTNMIKYGLVQGFSTSVVPMIPGIIAGIVTKNPAVTAGIAFASTAPIEDQEAYEESIKEGATRDEADVIGKYAGIINGALETVGEFLQLKGLLKPLKKNIAKEITKKTTRQIIARGLLERNKGVFGEALTEGTQEFVTNALIKTINENRDIFAGVLDSMIVGGVLGGGGSTLGAGGKVIEDVENNKKIDLATDIEALNYVMQGEERKAQRMQEKEEEQREKIKQKILSRRKANTWGEIEEIDNQDIGESEVQQTGQEIEESQIEDEMIDEVLNEENDMGDSKYQKNGDTVRSSDQQEAEGLRIDSNSNKGKVTITNENASEFSKKLDEIKNELEGLKADTFLERIKNSISGNQKTNYIINKNTDRKYVLRISSHHANAYNARGNKAGTTSIVIKLMEAPKFKKDNKVNLTEFVYDPANMTTEKMQGIIDGIKNWISTGEYTDTRFDSKNESTKKKGENKQSNTGEKHQLKYEEKGYTPGVANKKEKNISGKEGIKQKNTINDQTVEELAEKYGVKVEVIKGMIEILKKGKGGIVIKDGEAYGKYRDQLLTLSEQIKESTAPHELLHAIFDMIDPETKTYLIAQVMKSEGWNAETAEERLADSFSNFFRTGKIEGAPKSTWGRIKIFFKRVRSFINGMNKWRNELNEIFTDIITADGIVDLQSKIDESSRLNKSKERMRKRFMEYRKNAIKMQERAESENKYQRADSNQKDSDGKTISNGQAKYFKDSKIRDKDGNLLRVYHGTNSEYTVYDSSLLGASSGDLGFFGDGWYFATHKGEAGYYGRNIMEGYLNITNPFYYGNMTKIGNKDFGNNVYVTIRNLGKIDESINNREIDGYKVSEIGDMVDDYLKNVKLEKLNDAKDPYNGWDITYWKVTEYGKSEIQTAMKGLSENGMLDEQLNHYMMDKIGYLKPRDLIEEITDEARFDKTKKSFSQILQDKGYDGIVVGDTAYEADEIVAFRSNEFKNVDNLNPTDNEDIRYQKAGDINSPAFKKRFGNSKVVDENGNPLVVYHGTRNGGFTSFNKNDSGIRFSEDIDVADSYAGDDNRWTRAEIIKGDKLKDDFNYEGDEGIYKVYLSIKNPLVLDYEGYGATNHPELSAPSYYLENLSDEYDGVIARNIRDEGGWNGGVNDPEERYAENTVYGVKNPNQVKSATDNVGTYDANNDDIRYQKMDSDQKDNEGKTLSNGQAEYFKDSKVRDGNGNLLVVYHGTRGGDFTVFKGGKTWSNSLAKVGYWFTPSKKGALKFAEGSWGADGKPRAEEVYLNITNPKIYEPSEFNLLSNEEKEKARDEQRKVYNQKANKADGLDYTKAGGFFHDEFDHPYNERTIFEYLKRSWDNDRKYDGKYGKYDPEKYRRLAKDNNVDFDKILKDFEEYTKAKLDEEKEYTKLLDMKYDDPYENFQYDIYKIDSNYDNNWTKADLQMALNDYESPNKFREKLISEGYDGIIIKGTEYDGEVIGGGARNDQYVAFYSNQIKRTTNLNPTDNEDIRYQRVYHGSPADFDRFDSSHMGEGEGSQVHGWGHYVAVDENTGRRYAQLHQGDLYSNIMYKGESTRDMTRRGIDREDVNQVAPSDIMTSIVDGISRGKYDESMKVSDIAKDIINQRIEVYSNSYEKSGDWIKNAETPEEKAEMQRRADRLRDLIKAYKDLDEKDFDRPQRNLYEVEIPDPVKADTPTGSNYLEEGGDLTEKQMNEIMNKAEEYRYGKLKPFSEADYDDVEKIANEVFSDLSEQQRKVSVQQFIDDVDMLVESGKTISEAIDEELEFHTMTSSTIRDWKARAGLFEKQQYQAGKGESLYNELQYLLGGDKQASKFLESLGYDGIHYFGGRDGESYVIFNDDDLEIVNHERYQKAGDTNSEAFKKRFDGSKVVNEDGSPKIMYHGTPNKGFTVFKEGYFTENKEYADKYQNPNASSIRFNKKSDNPGTYAVYLSIKNPFDTRDPKAKKIFEKEYFGNYGMGTPLGEKGLPDWMDGNDLQEFIMENHPEYDGLILDEGGIGGYGEEVQDRGVSYVPFRSNQIKSATDNVGTYDANNEDIRYQRKDSEGNSLSEGQIKYFENSKIRKNGRLLVVYHGTHGDFTIFDRKKIGSKTNNKGIFGEGFYFTSDKKYGDYYAQPQRSKEYQALEGKTKEDIEKMRGKTMKGYLNITNPFYWRSIKTPNAVKKLIETLGLGKNDLERNSTLNNQMRPITDAKKAIKFRNALEKAGYDGIIYEYDGADKDGNKQDEIVAFYSNQFKNIDNKNPTDNADIRYQKTEYDYDKNGNRKWIKFGDNSEFDPNIFGTPTKEEQIEEDKENEKSNPFYNAWMKYNNQNYKDDQLTLGEFVDAVGAWGERKQEEFDKRKNDIAEVENDPKMLELQLKAVKLAEEETNVGKRFGKNVSKEVRNRQQAEVEKKREDLSKEIFEWMYPGLRFEEATYDDTNSAWDKEAEWEMLGREKIEEQLRYFKKDSNGNWEKKNIKLETPQEQREKIEKSGNFDEVIAPSDRVIEWNTPEGQKGRLDKAKDPKQFKKVMEKINSGKSKTKVELKDVTNEVRALERYKENEKAEKEKRKKEKQEEYAKKKQEEYKRNVRLKAFQRLVDMQRFEKFTFLTEDEIKQRWGFTDEEWKKITEQQDLGYPPKKRNEKAVSDFNKAVDSEVKFIREGLSRQNNMKKREAEKNLGEIGEIDLDVLLGRDEEKGQKEVEEFERIAEEEKKKSKKEKNKRLEQAREDVTQVEIDKERENSKSEKERVDKIIKSTKSDNTVWGSIKKTASDVITPVSTRIREISPKIYRELMKYFQNKDILTNQRLKEIDPFLKAMGKIRKKNPVRFMDIWVALANRDIGYANGLLQEYGVKVPTKLLDTIFDEAEDVGLNINYLGSYYPLSVKAPKSFLEELMKVDKGDIASEIEKKIQQESQKKGGPLDESEITAIINSVIAGEEKGPDVNLGNKHMKKRNTEIKRTPKMLEYCDDPISTLIGYVEGMTDKIERAKFLGKSRSGNVHTLADYVYNAKNGLDPTQQDELMELLKSVFNDASPNKFYQTWRDIATLTTLGSPSSTLTQIGDLSFSIYENGWREALKATWDIFMKRKAFDLKDMGVINRGEEYTNINSQKNLLQKAIHNVFKLTFFSNFDTFGKSTFIQSTWNKRRKRALKGENGDPQLIKDIMKITDDEYTTMKIINDLRNGVFSEDVALVMYMKLGNIQPLTRAQMPKTYLNNPNGRLFYQFKTFGIKQLDYVLQEIKQQIKGFKNLSTTEKFLRVAQIANMIFIMTLMGAGASELKDITMRRRSNSLILRWLFDEDVGTKQVWDKIEDSALQLFGLSRYTVMQAKSDPVDAITSLFTTFPATNLVAYPFKDIVKAFKNDGSINWRNPSAYQLIPVIGKYRYWIYGGGQDKQQEALDKENNKNKKGSKKKGKVKL